MNSLQSEIQNSKLIFVITGKERLNMTFGRFLKRTILGLTLSFYRLLNDDVTKLSLIL